MTSLLQTSDPDAHQLTLARHLDDPTPIPPSSVISSISSSNLTKADRKITVLNPANAATIATIISATPSDIARAVSSSSAALRDWRTTTPQVRSAALTALADLVSHHARDLSRIITLESGKPIGDGLAEVQFALSYFRWYASEALRTSGTSVTEISDTTRGVTTRAPVGFVAMIVPFNFPLAMAARKVAAALAAGCTCVVKPHTETPLSALALGVLAGRAGVPAGCVNILVFREECNVNYVEKLLEESVIRMLSFTGSTPVGVALAGIAARRLLRTSLELGSCGAPFIVFDDANVPEAVEYLVRCKVRGGGQSCISPDRIFVQEKVFVEFMRLLKEKVDELVNAMGNGMSEGVLVGPMINAKAVGRLRELVGEAVRGGALLEAGGDRICGIPSEGVIGDDFEGSVDDESGSFYPPTLLSGVVPSMRIFREEIFGPIFPVSRFADDDEPVVSLRTTEDLATGGLAAYVVTSSLSRRRRIVLELDVGMVALGNAGTLPDARTPFGGVGMSGEGREGGDGLAEYTYSKYVLESS